MGLFDKLQFWKKEEALPEMPAAPEILAPEQPAPMGVEHLGMPHPMEPPEPAFQPQSFGQQQQFTMSSDQQLQLISSKLDTIKAQLETVLQRLERLEKKDDLSPYQQRWRNV
ncbi:Uncharacterised protein [uncultured archaeon]|nr:Uncharacterised protein [uncultured archaeon]